MTAFEKHIPETKSYDFWHLLTKANSVLLNGQCFTDIVVAPVSEEIAEQKPSAEVFTVIGNVCDGKFEVNFSAEEVLAAKLDENEFFWYCGQFRITACVTSPVSPSTVTPTTDISNQRMDRYQTQNAARLIDGFYFPKPHEEASGNLQAAFERGRQEAIQNLKNTLNNLSALSAEAFFEERKKGLN